MTRGWRLVFGLPEMADPADQLSARLVARAVDLLLVATLAFGVLALVQRELVPRDQLWTLGAGLLLALVTRALVSRRRLRAAASLLCFLGWFAIAADVFAHGPHTVALGGFGVLVVLAGLTLGRWGVVAMVGASLALLAPVMLGWIWAGRTFPEVPFSARFVHYGVQLGLTGILVAWWSTHARALVREARTSRARLAALLDASPDAVVRLDRSGVTTFINPASEALLGYRAEEVVGRRWTDFPFMSEAAIRRSEERIEEAIQGRQDTVRELELHHRDGRTVHAEVKTVPIVEAGAHTGTLSVIRDVTSRHLAEVKRVTLERQLVTAQRMEAVGRIAGGIAHDFNNMLTVILSSAEALRLKGKADPAIVEEIQLATAKGATLTRQLLTFARQLPTSPRPVDLDQILQALRPMLERLMGEDVKTVFELGPSLPAVLLDPGQFDQVMVNLAANARDAMTREGTLTVRTQRVLAGVEVRVRDTGAGMDAQTQARVFEPFFTTKGERGTGLGLAVVHGVVHQAGGAIWCESAPGVGTTFGMTFPLVPSAAEPAATGGERAAAAKRGHLVLLDDDAQVRRSVTQALEASGFTVNPLGNDATLEQVEAALREAEALVTDVVMARTSGPELVDALRRRGYAKPVVFVSGHAEHALLARAASIPGARVLAKPFTADQLIHHLEQLGRR